MQQPDTRSVTVAELENDPPVGFRPASNPSYRQQPGSLDDSLSCGGKNLCEADARSFVPEIFVEFVGTHETHVARYLQ